MAKKISSQALKLANECFKAMAEEEQKYTSPVCKAYSGMICIHPRYLPTCKRCVIMGKKLKV